MKRRRLFWKYVIVIVGLVTVALVASGAIELWFSYQENKQALVGLQREKAIGAAARIEAFVKEIERQMGWTTQPVLAAPGAAGVEARRFDFLRLLRQVPPITEVSYLDGTGREELRVSRLAMDVLGSAADLSKDPRFVQARARKTYYGPVYFRKESEPYMTLAMAGAALNSGVTVAEVNLKFIWDVVSQIRVGKAGYAYVVDDQGALIAHPDISLVLQKTSLGTYPQVTAALTGATAEPVARGLGGGDVLTASALIPTLKWAVLVEQPVEEALAPLRESLKRTVLLIGLGVAFAIVASLLLARRMVTPIQALQEGAARLGAGELAHRLTVRTGDELQTLADRFNSMAGQLQESYANLEGKVEERTRELSETLEQQTATAEILRVISSSPTDVQPVFDTIVRNARRLCGGFSAIVVRVDAGQIQLAAIDQATEQWLDRARRHFPLPLDRQYLAARAILDGTLVHVPDIEEDPSFPAARELAQAMGYRCILFVPMFREGLAIGGIGVTRREPEPFSDGQVALLQTFADQAVIAIENVRLFTELNEKNQVVTESLERQIATAEILRVISGSPTDTAPVFDAILTNALRLCEAELGFLFRYDGENFAAVGERGAPPAWRAALGPTGGVLPRPGPHTGLGRIVAERRPVHIPDVVDDEAYRQGDPMRRRTVEVLGARTFLAVPMLKEGTLVGAFVIYRKEVRPFDGKQIDLVQTFADQAVIAIENVRLFTELQDKHAQITEALERQTATSEILRAISGAFTDARPVFRAILERATRLCSAELGLFWRYDGDSRFSLIESFGSSQGYARWAAGQPRVIGPPFFRPAGPWRAGQIEDVRATAPYRQGDELWVRSVDDEGFRTLLNVPLVKDGQLIGSLSIYRREVRRFTDAQVDLVKTFADQAVIAIENVRLFTELQARTRELARTVEELTALGEVGRAISSTLDLDAVLTTVVAQASQLAGADGCSIYEFDDATRTFTIRASSGAGELLEAQRQLRIAAGEGAVGRLALTPEPVQVPDISDASYHGPLRDVLLRLGYRSLLAVPLIREDELVGGLVVSRAARGEFPAKTVELLRTFATQAVLAIQNARLFQELEDKSRQLEIADRHKSEFLANMSHELRTPLNAIIGFSEVLLERMFGDLNAKQAEYVEDVLSSGRHLLSLINDILDLSKIEAGRMELELTTFSVPAALDNALTLVRERATRHGIALDLELDPAVGEIRGDERKIKQVLLNLLSNAVKFTPEGGTITVRASAGPDAVAIAVADTGIGIAPEDQRAIFEEFRQVGSDYARKREGTGLGLTLARKFVELHGGRLDVDSEPGKGSTFTFTIPV